jgi:hypothetical protein
MSFRAPSGDLARFSELLTAELHNIASPAAEDEWLAFVCSPIRFSIQHHTEDTVDSLGRELTGWRSYAKIGDRVVSDHEYAFEPPLGFIRQTGNRARSWPGYYFISREHDVAIQLLASVATTPADQLFQSMLREHLLGQFLPWECPRGELHMLQQRLWDAELVFAPVEEDKPNADESEFITGAISTPMFAPAIGMIPQAQSWAELEQGTVRNRLEMTALIDCIPGREGSSELRNKLLNRLSHLTQDVPDGWLVDETKPEPGLPIDLASRRVVVQRFRSAPAFHPEQATLMLQEAATALANYVPDADSIEINGYIIDSFKNIAELSISWSPQLNESSAMALQSALPMIIEVFDKALPRSPPTTGYLATSLDVLRFAGELYFEGDRIY